MSVVDDLSTKVQSLEKAIVSIQANMENQKTELQTVISMQGEMMSYFQYLLMDDDMAMDEGKMFCDLATAWNPTHCSIPQVEFEKFGEVILEEPSTKLPQHEEVYSEDESMNEVGRYMPNLLKQASYQVLSNLKPFKEIETACLDEGLKLKTTGKEEPDNTKSIDAQEGANEAPNNEIRHILEGEIKYTWNVLPVDQRDGMKNYISEVVVKLSSDEISFWRERLCVNKLNIILVQQLKHEWPSRWRSFIPDLVAILPDCRKLYKSITPSSGRGTKKTNGHMGDEDTSAPDIMVHAMEDFYGFVLFAQLALGLRWFLWGDKFWKEVIRIYYHSTTMIALPPIPRIFVYMNP